MKIRLTPCKFLLGAAMLLPLPGWSQPYVLVPGNDDPVNVERILVRPNGDLVVTINGQPRDITREQYVRAVGVKPPEIDQAQALINQGNTEEAAKLLEGVIQSSRFLSWDAFAGEKLAALQLKGGSPLDAKATLDNLERRYGDNLITFFPFLEKTKWDVRVNSGDLVGLEDELTQVIKSKQASTVRKAGALIVRGDLKASRKDYKSAVLDYLRVNYFYGDNPELQPEALYKTADMFAKIGDTGRLRKYSTLLKEKYPQSEFATMEIGG